MSAAISAGYVKSPASGENPPRHLVLVGHRLLQQPHRRQHREVPEQLGDLRDVRLAEERAAGRVEAAGQEIKGHVQGELIQAGPVPHRRQRVEVRDEVERLPLVLELDELLDRPEVVPDMDLVGRLDSGQNSHGFGRGF